MSLRGPLELNGKDWRLDPITWFNLCTPDFGEDREGFWGGDFVKLKRKMEKTTFWQHYIKLKSEAYRIQSDYEQVAEKLSQSQKGAWDRIQRERNRYFLPSRVPIRPEPDWDEWSPVYDSDFCESVVRVFRSVIPDLDDLLIAMEELLQKLNDDLSDKHSR